MTLREYLSKDEVDFETIYHVRDSQDLELCQQVMEIVLEGLDVSWPTHNGHLRWADVSVPYVGERTTGIEITLSGEVGGCFKLQPSRIGSLKFAWVNLGTVGFEPITLPGEEGTVEIYVRLKGA